MTLPTPIWAWPWLQERGGSGAWSALDASPFRSRPSSWRVFLFAMNALTVISTDLLTPLGAYLKLREGGRASFLLESVEHGRLRRPPVVGSGAPPRPAAPPALGGGGAAPRRVRGGGARRRAGGRLSRLRPRGDAGADGSAPGR